MFTEHLILKKLLQTTVYISIKSPALFAAMVMLMSEHNFREERLCYKVRLRSGQIIISVQCRLKFNNSYPHTCSLKSKAKNSLRVVGENLHNNLSF